MIPTCVPQLRSSHRSCCVRRTDNYNAPRDDQWPYEAGTGNPIDNTPVTVVAITCYKGNSGDGDFEFVPGSTPTVPQGY